MSDGGGSPGDDPPAGESDDRPSRPPPDRSGCDQPPADSGRSRGNHPPAREGRGPPGSDDRPLGARSDKGASPGPDVPEQYRDWDGPNRRPRGIREWARWVWTVRSGPVLFVREVLSSVAFVVGIGLLLFAVSGVWPPMVAVQSGSMQPHMHTGDLVFIVEEQRFSGAAAVKGTGIVTYRSGLDTDHQKFGKSGDVVVYKPNGRDRPDPIIHRAMFWVEEGENWYDEADPAYVGADDCADLSNCPAPNSGFITKGDHNRFYDQTMGMSRPVRQSWIQGKAVLRIPLLGHIRLGFGDLLAAFGGLGRGVALLAGALFVRPKLTVS